MKLLKEIKDCTTKGNDFELREAVRGVFRDEYGLIALLYVGKYLYHKLPGGGIDFGEERMDALRRETKEELGAEIEKINGEVGFIVEYRKKYQKLQISYCYYGKIIKRGEPDFTEKEISEEFQIIWCSLDEAIDRLTKDETKKYEGKFIQKRDLAFLKEYKKIIGI